MPPVAISHTAEKHLTREGVLSLASGALEHLGGMEGFVKPGQSVLITPGAADALVIGALIHLARIAGASGIRVAGRGGELAAVAARDLIAGVMQLWLGVINRRRRALICVEDDIAECVADIMTEARPDLCITDALVCGEADGPLATSPHWCGCLLASADPVIMDVAIARLLGHDWEKLRFAAAAEERGLGRRAPFVSLGAPIERFAFRAWSGHNGHGYLPLNFLAGKGVTLAGTVGHVKSALDKLLREGALERVRGTPTIMAGDVEDPEFERHIQEGPYLVFDDAARPECKNHPRVYFVPGHPVLDSALPELLRGLGIDFEREAVRPRRRRTAVPASFVVLAAGVVVAIRAILRRA
jgi:hypothetical protein